MESLTYLQFLLIFIAPLVLVEGFLLYQTKDSQKAYVLRGIYLLATVAVVYTTPWDNYLVMTHVWSYEDSRVLGKIGYVPIEEYSFFVLQSLLSGFWCYFVQRKVAVVEVVSDNKWLFRVGAVKIFLLLLLGFYLIGLPESRYMGLILVWALPIVLLQWLIGGAYLLSNIKTYMLSLWPVTLYLWVVDAIAIHLQVWKISMTQTLGFYILNLPIEEAVFFLVTNLMLIQGLILFIAMKNSFRFSHLLRIRKVD